MKQLLTCCMLMLIAVTGYAQSFSAGLRAGVGYWCTSDRTFGYHLQTLQGSHLAFVPELFVRFNLRKHWAFEVALNQSNHQYTEVYPGGYHTPWDTITEVKEIRNRALVFSAQYDLSSVVGGKRSGQQKLRNYLGLTISPVFVRGRTYFYPDHSANIPFSSTGNYLEFWTGLSHTLTYDIGRHLMVMSRGYVDVRPTELLAHRPMNYYYYAVAKFGAQLGFAYRF